LTIWQREAQSWKHNIGTKKEAQSKKHMVGREKPKTDMVD